MLLSIPTLILIGGVIAFTTGILLAVSWLQNQRDRSLYFWAIANVVAAGAPPLFYARGVIPDFFSIHLANIGLILSAAIAWAGTRVFERRSFAWWQIALGPLVWAVLNLVPAIEASMAARTIVSAVVIAAYMFASAYEHWLGRYEKLMSRWPSITMLVTFGIFYLARIPVALVTDFANQRDFLSGPMLSGTLVFALVYVVSISFLRLAMARERAESDFRMAASTDQLKGIFNRRAFFEAGSKMLETAGSTSSPCALLVLDVDYFKAINDGYGHAGGDHVLIEFACRLRTTLGPEGFLARIGGEEFAIILAGISREDAFAMAEKLRTSIADDFFRTLQGKVAVTVSVGAAFSDESGYNIDRLLRHADTALYCAKRNGRNRIECAVIDEEEDERLAA